MRSGPGVNPGLKILEQMSAVDEAIVDEPGYRRLDKYLRVRILRA